MYTEKKDKKEVKGDGAGIVGRNEMAILNLYFVRIFESILTLDTLVKCNGYQSL